MKCILLGIHEVGGQKIHGQDRLRRRPVEKCSIMHSDFQAWESYPVSIQRCQADIDDTRQYQEELKKRSGDLFVSDSSLTKLELLESRHDSGMLQFDGPNFFQFTKLI